MTFWRTVARVRLFAGLLRGGSVRQAEGRAVKRCQALTAAKRPCRARPLKGTDYCALHTEGRAAELGRRGGLAGRGSRQWRGRGIDVGSSVHARVPLADLIAASTLTDSRDRAPIGPMDEGGGGASTEMADALSGIPPGRSGSGVGGTLPVDANCCLPSGEFDPMAWQRREAARQDAKERLKPDPSVRPWESFRGWPWDDSDEWRK
jgi:hypothetical protein